MTVTSPLPDRAPSLAVNLKMNVPAIPKLTSVLNEVAELKATAAGQATWDH
jgi:hypothetical protein